MKILVCSCDKDADLFLPFHHCMEKYWPNHPEVIYSTETVYNPYYKTICINYPVEKWTTRVKETVKEIEDDHILLMCDDIFIRKPADDNILKLDNWFDANTASINLQVGNNKNYINVGNNLLKMHKNAEYKTSVMCSLWAKDKLLDVFEDNLSPWEFELKNNSKDYDYYRLVEPVLEWGLDDLHAGNWGLRYGKWTKEVIEFLTNEGLNIDYSIRGII